MLIKDNGEVVGYPTKLSKDLNLSSTKWYKQARESGKNLWIEDHAEGLPKEYDSGYILSLMSPYTTLGDNKNGGF